MAFSTFRMCTTTTYKKFVLPPKGNPIPMSFPILPTPSVPINLPILDISYKWNHTVCDTCVWLPSLSIIFLRFIHIVACFSISFLFMAE